MDVHMADSTIWWLLAGVTVAIELLSGTFYLLMLAIGLACGAMAAHAGASTPVQLIVAAVVGGGSVVLWRRYKQLQPSSAPARANRDVNLDIGESVHVDAWQEDGTAQVKYRGAAWTVALAPGREAVAGAHRVVEVVGNRLVVEHL
jgi:membrane protein implicated in regulation of membrane protease activity